MYTGTMIEDLMKTVERTEKRSLQSYSTENKLMYFYTRAQSELTSVESLLLGVA